MTCETAVAIEFIPERLQVPNVLNPKLQLSEKFADDNSDVLLVKKACSGKTVLTDHWQ